MLETYAPYTAASNINRCSVFSVLMLALHILYHICTVIMSYLKQLIRNGLNADLNNKPVWVKMIGSVLLQCDEKQIWEEQAIVNVNALVNRVCVKLEEKYNFFRQFLD